MKNNKRKSQPLMQIDDLRPWKIEQAIIEHPSARFMRCICDTVNPLGILRASTERIQAAVSQAEYYDLITRQWSPIDTAKFIETLRRNYEVRYAQYLDKSADLIVFCFIPIS